MRKLKRRILSKSDQEPGDNGPQRIRLSPKEKKRGYHKGPGRQVKNIIEKQRRKSTGGTE